MAARGESLGSGEATRVLRGWFGRSREESPKSSCRVLANATTAVTYPYSVNAAPLCAPEAPETVPVL